MSRIPRVPVLRNWTERHAHKSIKLAEDEHGRIWIRLEDLRQWMPGLTPDRELFKTHPMRVGLTDHTVSPYIEASAFLWLTQKSSNPPTLKLRAWLESHVIAPARQRHQWEDYRGREPLRTHRDLGPPRAELAEEVVEVRMPWQARLNPDGWLITQGQWRLRTTLIVGTGVSLLAVFLSLAFDARAWDVENSYRLWTWIGLLTAVWAVVWNGAWMIGAIRSARRTGRQDAPVWRTSLWLLCNLGAALLTAGITLGNSQLLVQSWWLMVKEGDPPAQVLVASVDTEGRAQRLLVQGPIGMGSTQALRAVLAQHPGVPEVELHSPGGLVVEGFGMARVLAESGVRTSVWRECASACTSVFLAGRERVIGPHAQLGFHRSYSITGDLGTGWNDADHEMANQMRAKGVSEGFIRAALATPGSQLWVPTPDELVGAGFVTARISEP